MAASLRAVRREGPDVATPTHAAEARHPTAIPRPPHRVAHGIPRRGGRTRRYLEQHGAGARDDTRIGSTRTPVAGNYAARSDGLRDHLDRPARALLHAQPAALAVVEVERVRVRAAGIELDHGVVGADAVAVVAREAAAAGEAAARLEQRGRLVEPAYDLVERRRAADALELRLDGARRVVVVPRVQRGELGGRRGHRVGEDVAAQPCVDVPRRGTAVADRGGHRALGGHDVAAGKDARVAGHQVRADLDDAVAQLDARHPLQQPEVGLLAE